MGIRFHEYRKKPWVVTWRNPWTGKKHTNAFCSESEATAFATAQTELAAREKAMLRKTRRKKQQHGRIRVSELLETYFLNAQTNPLTKRQAQYHASHILAAFGKRVSADLERQDILNFSQAQQERGIAPTTIYRRVSILRAALNWAAQNGLLRENPLRDLRLTRAKSRRIAPPNTPRSKGALGSCGLSCSARNHSWPLRGAAHRPKRAFPSGVERRGLLNCHATHAKRSKDRVPRRPGHPHPLWSCPDHARMASA